jgi:hypothetical protein
MAVMDCVLPLMLASPIDFTQVEAEVEVKESTDDRIFT